MPTQANEIALRLTTGWGESIGLRSVIGFIGALLLLYLVSRLRQGKARVLPAAGSLCFGAAMLAFSIYPEQIITWFVQVEYMQRVRMIAAGLSAAVLLITVESIRRTHLQERYALLWVATGLIILLLAAFPHAVDLLRLIMGLEYASAVMVVVFTFLLSVSFHFSLALSSSEENQTQLSQRHAVLESTVRELQARIDAIEKRDGDTSLSLTSESASDDA